jgi:2,3-bisphosphoglycerate-dependent phosphoglycerate mutase
LNLPPAATRILAIRHGETDWNASTRIQGHTDIPLNKMGRWQARQLALALAHETINVIYASDLSRAFETARAVGKVQGQRVVAVPLLRERHFGAFQSRQFRDIEVELPEQAERWRKRDPEFCPEGGESLQTFYARCVGAAQQVARAHPGQTIALVAHGGVMDCLYRAALRIDLQTPRSWALGNASINRLLYTGEGFSLVGWSDTAHLDRVVLDEIPESSGPQSRHV